MSPLNFVRRITSSSFVTSFAGKPSKGVYYGGIIVGLVLVLLLQLSPALRVAVYYAANPFQWTRTGWLGLNAVVIAVLLGVRYGKDQLERIAAHRARWRQERTEIMERRERAEERERMRQLQAARRRRLY